MSYNKGQSINNKCTTAHAKGSRWGRMEEGKERKDRVRGKKKCHH